MGSRGSGSGRKGIGRKPEVDKTVKRIAKRTANLKNEQYRIIDEDGNVILEKKGDKNSVAATVGEKREAMWYDDKEKTTIHNHPDGGTFSSADFDDFGFGAKEVVVATPEGTYSLVNDFFGKPNSKGGWTKLRDATQKIDAIESEKSGLYYRKKAEELPNVKKLYKQMNTISNNWVKAKNSGADSSTLSKYFEQYDKVSKDYSDALKAGARKLETDVYHNFYKKNAKKYGFTYTFTPNS